MQEINSKIANIKKAFGFIDESLAMFIVPKSPKLMGFFKAANTNNKNRVPKAPRDRAMTAEGKSINLTNRPIVPKMLIARRY